MANRQARHSESETPLGKPQAKKLPGAFPADTYPHASKIARPDRLSLSPWIVLIGHSRTVLSKRFLVCGKALHLGVRRTRSQSSRLPAFAPVRKFTSRRCKAGPYFFELFRNGQSARISHASPDKFRNGASHSRNRNGIILESGHGGSGFGETSPRLAVDFRAGLRIHVKREARETASGKEISTTLTFPGSRAA